MLPHKNPIIYRQWRIASRPGKFWGTLLGVAVLLVLGHSYISLQTEHHYTPDAEYLPLNFVRFVLAIHVVIAFYFSFGITLNSIAAEKQRKTHEFLTTLPISSASKVFGLTVGHNLMSLLLIVLMTPVVIISGRAGGISMSNLVWLEAIIYTGFFAAALTGVAFSGSLGGRTWGWLVVIAAIFVGVALGSASEWNSGFKAVPLMLGSPFAVISASTDITNYSLGIFSGNGYHFYNMEVPWQLCLVVFYAYIAVVSYWLAVRKLSRPEGRPMRRGGTLLAFVIFQVLLIGFLHDAMTTERQWAINVAASYMTCFFCLITLWSLATTAQYGQMMQWVERKGSWPGRIITESFSDIRTPPFAPAGMLWGVTLCAVLLANMLCIWNISDLRLIFAGLIFLLFLWAYEAVFLFGCQLSRRSGRFLGGLLLLAIVLVPVIFSTIPGIVNVINATPFGLMSSHGNLLTSRFSETSSTPLQSAVAALVILAVFGALASWRYELLLRLSPRGK